MPVPERGRLGRWDASVLSPGTRPGLQCSVRADGPLTVRGIIRPMIGANKVSGGGGGQCLTSFGRWQPVLRRGSSSLTAVGCGCAKQAALCVNLATGERKTVCSCCGVLATLLAPALAGGGAQSTTDGDKFCPNEQSQEWS